MDSDCFDSPRSVVLFVMDNDEMWSMFAGALKLKEDMENQEKVDRGRVDREKVDNKKVISDISRHIKSQKNRTNECASCGEPFSEHVSDGYIACVNCGLVKDSYIDGGAEWRCFNLANGSKDLSGVRCGEPASSLLPGTQLNTFVGGKDKRLQRVHQWNNLTPKERNMHQVYREFEQIGHTHRLGKAVVNAATQLYSRLYTEMENKNCGVKRCNVRQGLKAACLYFTCKQLNTPRERKEIAEMMGNTTRIVTKGCNSFLDIMGGDFIRMEPFTPRDFVERFCLLLGISYPMQRRLEVIVEYVSTLESLVDNTPTSVTSACIYFLSREYNLKISKETIHKTCGSSQIIITKTFSKIVPHASEIQELLKSYDRSP